MTYAASLPGTAFMAANPHRAYEVGTGDFTVAAWVRTAAPGGTGTVIGRKGTEGGAGQGGFLVVIQPEGFVKFATDNGTGFWEAVTATRTVAGDGYWHHLAAVRRAGALEIYVDGVRQQVVTRGTGTSPLNVSNGRRLTVGCVDQTQERYRFLTGTVGAVAFWAGARTAQQVAADMRTVPEGAEPLGYWGFDLGDGSDRSRQNNPMAAVGGGVTFTSPGAPVTKGDFAAVLNAGGHLAAPPNNAYVMQANDFTIEAWVRTAVPGGSGTVVGYKGTEGGPQQGGYLLVVRPDGTIKFATDDGTTFREVVTVPTAVNDTRWHHVAAVRRQAVLVVCLDGREVAGAMGGPGAGPLPITSVRRLTIGTVDQAQERYRPFTGAVDEVKLWRVARTVAQVAADMGAEPRADEPGLAGYWPFSYQSGHDLSAVANAAAITGNVTFQTPGARGDHTLSLTGGAFLSAPAHPAYTIGTGDFTVEAWIRAPAGGSGTVVGRKGTEGGPGKGGFLLTVKPDGMVSFATDDGMSFWVADTAPAALSDVTVNDGYWHHLAGIRRSGLLEIHIDGRNVPVTANGSGRTPLNVDNGLRLTIGGVDQAQEPYRAFSGSVGAVALWRSARPAADLSPLKGDEPGLAGYWDFGLRDGSDLSPAHNTMTPTGTVTYVSPGPPYGQVIADAPVPTQLAYDAGTLHLEWRAVASPPAGGAYAVEVLDADNRPVATAQSRTISTDVPVTLDPAVRYRTRVRAVGAFVAGPWSAAVPLVSAVPEVTAVEYDGTTVKVAFTATSGVTAELVVDGKPAATASGTTGPLELRKTITATEHAEVRLRATAGIAAGPWTAAVPVIAAVPQGLLVACDGTGITVAWQPLTGAARYSVEVIADGVPGDPVDAPAGPTTHMALAPGVTYEAQVRGRNGVSQGPWSPPAAGPYARHQVVTRDGLGRIRQVSDEHTRTAYEYDPFGNVTSITTTPAS
ncbi:LamG-like jellyroll fold domain-containing protein [Nonomuraea jiangxiensis]|uniref:YD repeat-containing protein n=1 Tax=Nonomuraea jiangxiensis TaxID=633440 RepID=A0A1G9N9V8_9ACTN|nr:LamG-like jellyroll fold domain-containing protein [Nonomuraea jiangxiensis]SDL83234.1 YD repeat-containing protein [Nonomuraea jiangxiensis]